LARLPHHTPGYRLILALRYAPSQQTATSVAGRANLKSMM